MVLTKDVMQIGIVVKDLDKAMETYWKTFGWGPWDIYTIEAPMLEPTEYSKAPDYSFKIALAQVGHVQMELVQPLKGENIYTDHLRRHGEGFHHIKEKVDDIPGTIEKFKQMGINVTQSGKIDEDLHFYLDTEKLLGYVYELGNSGKIRPPEARYPPDA